MKMTKIERRTNSFIIKMDSKKGKNKRKIQYGAYHNQGYTNSKSSAFPGAKIPKREWFGIPKSMRFGGKEFNSFVILLTKLIHKSVRG